MAIDNTGVLQTLGTNSRLFAGGHNMSRPINLERLAAREEQARVKEEEYRLRRIRESKAFHSAQGKEHTKRLAALGQLVEDIFPDKTVTEIAGILHDSHWVARGHQAEYSGYLGVCGAELAIHDL